MVVVGPTIRPALHQQAIALAPHAVHLPGGVAIGAAEAHIYVAVAARQDIAGVEIADGAIAHVERGRQQVLDVDAGAAQGRLVGGNAAVFETRDVADEINSVNGQPVGDAPAGDLLVEEPVLGIALLDRAGDHPPLYRNDVAQHPIGDQLAELLCNGVAAVHKGRRPNQLLLCRQCIERANLRGGATDRLFDNDGHPRLEQARSQLRRAVVAGADQCKFETLCSQ